MRRLVSDRTQGNIGRVFTYDVDPDTFAPVGGEIRFVIDGDSFDSRYVVNVYDRLPDTPQNAKLLTIPTKPSTKVTVHTPEQRRARERRARKGCVPTRDGHAEKCPLHPLPPPSGGITQPESR